MNIKETLEKLNKYTEATTEKNWESAINFETIGCGIEVCHGTSEDGFHTLYCSGFSSNSAKNLDFKSDIEVGYGKPLEDRQQANERLKEVKKQIQAELLQLANEFDNKVVELFAKYNFTK